MDGTEREVLALQFDFYNADGSIKALPVILGREGGGKHRPLDRRKTWMDLRKGSQIVIWYPGRKPEVRRFALRRFVGVCSRRASRDLLRCASESAESIQNFRQARRQ